MDTKPGLRGLGFVFAKSGLLDDHGVLMYPRVKPEDADPFVFVDLDHCVDELSQLTPRAREIVARFNSYTEWSPSGTGLVEAAPGDEEPLLGAETAHDTLEFPPRMYIHGLVAGLDLDAQERRIETQRPICWCVAQLSPGVLGGDVEPYNGFAPGLQRVLMVSLDNGVGSLLIAVFGHVASKLIVKHVGEPLVKHQGEDEVFELWCVLSTANSAGSIPEPLLQSRHVQMVIVCRHEGQGGWHGGKLPLAE
jgi:hypothetical protein